MLAFIPDGYFANGAPRPLLAVAIFQKMGRYYRAYVIDTKTIVTVPYYSIIWK